MNSRIHRAKPRAIRCSECLSLASSILSAPPAKEWVERPTEPLLERCVVRAAFPAHLCRETNARLGRHHLADAGAKERLWKMLEDQALPFKQACQWPVDAHVGHRPQVIAIKFADRSNDSGSNPGKMVIDMLTPMRCRDHKRHLWVTNRIGIITDDRPAVVQQLHWCEFLPRKFPPFVLIEVRI